MQATECVTLLRAFIVNELLDGRSGDLTPSTPLLELGILDSFSMAEMVGFIQKTFDVSIEDIEVTPDNFRTLETITNLILTKKGTNADSKPG